MLIKNKVHLITHILGFFEPFIIFIIKLISCRDGFSSLAHKCIIFVHVLDVDQRLFSKHLFANVYLSMVGFFFQRAIVIFYEKAEHIAYNKNYYAYSHQRLQLFVYILKRKDMCERGVV